MARAKKKDKISITKLLSWLDGVLAFADDGEWSPDAKQWNEILEKVRSLECSHCKGKAQDKVPSTEDIRTIVSEELGKLHNSVNMHQAPPPPAYNPNSSTGGHAGQPLSTDILSTLSPTRPNESYAQHTPDAGPPRVRPPSPVKKANFTVEDDDEIQRERDTSGDFL